MPPTGYGPRHARKHGGPSPRTPTFSYVPSTSSRQPGASHPPTASRPPAASSQRRPDYPGCHNSGPARHDATADHRHLRPHHDGSISGGGHRPPGALCLLRPPQTPEPLTSAYTESPEPHPAQSQSDSTWTQPALLVSSQVRRHRSLLPASLLVEVGKLPVGQVCQTSTPVLPASDVQLQDQQPGAIIRIKDSTTNLRFLVDTGTQFSVLPATSADRSRGSRGLDLQAANSSSISSNIVSLLRWSLNEHKKPF